LPNSISVTGTSYLINKNPYTWSGTGLLICGSIIGISAYLIFDSIWLTSLGICLFVLSIVIITLGKSVSRLPSEACSLLLETGFGNVTALLEELGVQTKALFLPSSLTNRQPRAFIPLDNNGQQPEIRRALPRRFITRYGTGPEEIGILVPTIGSAATAILDSKPEARFTELESALTLLFTGKLGLAGGAKVSGADKHITVEIIKPRLENGVIRYNRCLGSPLATIIASVTAEAWDTPVTINREEQDKGKHYVELELVQ
jgi:hypothetical protein